MEKHAKNDLLGGVDYYLSAGDNPGDLPERLRELVTDQLWSAVNDHKAFFGCLRDQCGFEMCSRWFDMISKSAGVCLNLYEDDMNQRDAMISVPGGMLDIRPTVSLEVEAPEPLVQIFSCIGALHEYGRGDPYVLEYSDLGAVEDHDDRMLTYASGPPRGSRLHQFYSADAGDSMAAVGADVYKYHLGGSVHKHDLGLAQTLNNYFARFIPDAEGGEFSFAVDYDKVLKT